MKVFVLGLFCLVLVGAPLFAQDSWSQVPQAPPGVKYTPLSAERMREEGARVGRILAPGYAGDDHLFTDFVFCGPGLWQTWKKAKFPESIESIPATFNPGGEGRCFRGKSLSALDDQLRETLVADGGFQARRPTTHELARFWAIIDFDITEPLIMLESPRRVLLLYSGKISWVDDYSR
ncbi:hypothetical protein IV102_22600 [bacterium]|nr:hypothetical protein [bacterium]